MHQSIAKHDLLDTDQIIDLYLLQQELSKAIDDILDSTAFDTDERLDVNSTLKVCFSVFEM